MKIKVTTTPTNYLLINSNSPYEMFKNTAAIVQVINPNNLFKHLKEYTHFGTMVSFDTVTLAYDAIAIVHQDTIKGDMPEENGYRFLDPNDVQIKEIQQWFCAGSFMRVDRKKNVFFTIPATSDRPMFETEPVMLEHAVRKMVKQTNDFPPPPPPSDRTNNDMEETAMLAAHISNEAYDTIKRNYQFDSLDTCKVIAIAARAFYYDHLHVDDWATFVDTQTEFKACDYTDYSLQWCLAYIERTAKFKIKHFKL